MMVMSLILSLALQAAAPAVVQTVAKDQMSVVETPLQAVARTDAEWAALWRKHAGNKAAPKVDLASRTVVAVFLGSRPSSGFTVEITRTREANGVLTVEWRERRPDAGAVTAQIITSPAHIATIPRHAGEIRFEKLAQ